MLTHETHVFDLGKKKKRKNMLKKRLKPKQFYNFRFRILDRTLKKEFTTKYDCISIPLYTVSLIYKDNWIIIILLFANWNQKILFCCRELRTNCMKCLELNKTNKFVKSNTIHTIHRVNKIIFSHVTVLK